jgi:hypothetical protein
VSNLLSDYLEFGGHGRDGELGCDTVRCPQYDEMVTSNLGETFEGGCGFDPLFGQLDSWGHADTGGCCLLNDDPSGTSYNCRACNCDSTNGNDCASELIETNAQHQAKCPGCVMEGVGVSSNDQLSNNFTCDLYAQAMAANANDDAMLNLNIINRNLNSSVQLKADCEALSPFCRVYTCDLTTDGGCASVPSTFFIEDDFDKSIKLRLCGPTDFQMTFDDEVVYRPKAASTSYGKINRTKTSGSFLCSLTKWVQGDYVDDAGLNGLSSHDLAGLGIQYGVDGIVGTFPDGRHVRRNYNAINKDTSTDPPTFSYGSSAEGEGIFVCHNQGSCLAPEECSCTDGWTGFDCSVPMCRHLRPFDFYGTSNYGDISSCANGGVCRDKDACACVTTASLLWTVHPEHTLRGMTGWMGTDCSTPICSQGYYDPFCTDVEQSPGGEGCFRCSNGGNCTAPDVCVCAEGWTGFDCRTPVCEAVADSLIRWQLNTVDEEKIHTFEADPCAAVTASGYEEVSGFAGTGFTAEMSMSPRGECVLPNECLCLCKHRYNPNKCHRLGGEGSSGTTPFEFEGVCEGAWQDDLYASRNVLEIFEIFGTRDCWEGYEGIENEMDRFTTCHLTIVVPTQLEYISLTLIILSVVVFIIGASVYW